MGPEARGGRVRRSRGGRPGGAETRGPDCQSLPQLPPPGPVSSAPPSPHSGRTADRQCSHTAWRGKEPERPALRQGPAEDPLLERLQPLLRELQPPEGSSSIFLPRAGQLVKEHQNQPGASPHSMPGPVPNVWWAFPPYYGPARGLSSPSSAVVAQRGKGTCPKLLSQ